MTIKNCSYVFLFYILIQNQLLRSIHLLQKPFYCSFIIPLLMHNKNRFSTDCTLPRSSALLLSYVQAGIHGLHTAHTRLQHTLCSGKHPLKTDCIQLAWVHWQLLVSMAQWDCMQSPTTTDGVTPTFTY